MGLVFNGRSTVKGGNSGYWYANIPSTVVAHECGHILGLPDKYNESTGGVLQGWSTNIMATRFGNIEQRNIDEIMNLLLKEEVNNDCLSQCR